MSKNHSETLDSETKSVIRPIFDQLTGVMEENLTTLLDEELTVQTREFYRVENQQLPESFYDDFLLYEGTVAEEIDGRMYILLSLKSAVTLSGIILGTSDQQRKEHRRLEKLPEASRDGADEVANHLFGFFGKAVREHLNRQISLSKSGGSKISISNKGKPVLDEISENKCLGLSYNIQLPQFEDCPFLLIFPVDLMEKLIERNLEEENVSTLFLPWKAEESNQAHRETLLVVDKNKEERAQLSTVLKSEGFEVVTATSGRDALKKINNQEVDALLTKIDIVGFGLLNNIDHFEHNSDLPIMIVSKDRSERMIQGAVSNIGASKCLVKPYDPEEVLREVSDLLENT